MDQRNWTEEQENDSSWSNDTSWVKNDTLHANGKCTKDSSWPAQNYVFYKIGREKERHTRKTGIPCKRNRILADDPYSAGEESCQPSFGTYFKSDDLVGMGKESRDKPSLNSDSDTSANSHSVLKDNAYYHENQPMNEFHVKSDSELSDMTGKKQTSTPGSNRIYRHRCGTSLRWEENTPGQGFDTSQTGSDAYDASAEESEAVSKPYGHCPSIESEKEDISIGKDRTRAIHDRLQDSIRSCHGIARDCERAAELGNGNVYVSLMSSQRKAWASQINEINEDVSPIPINMEQNGIHTSFIELCHQTISPKHSFAVARNPESSTKEATSAMLGKSYLMPRGDNIDHKMPKEPNQKLISTSEGTYNSGKTSSPQESENMLSGAHGYHSFASDRNMSHTDETEVTVPPPPRRHHIAKTLQKSLLCSQTTRDKDNLLSEDSSAKATLISSGSFPSACDTIENQLVITKGHEIPKIHKKERQALPTHCSQVETSAPNSSQYVSTKRKRKRHVRHKGLEKQDRESVGKKSHFASSSDQPLSSYRDEPKLFSPRLKPGQETEVCPMSPEIYKDNLLRVLRSADDDDAFNGIDGNARDGHFTSILNSTNDVGKEISLLEKIQRQQRRLLQRNLLHLDDTETETVSYKPQDNVDRNSLRQSNELHCNNHSHRSKSKKASGKRSKNTFIGDEDEGDIDDDDDDDDDDLDYDERDHGDNDTKALNKNISPRKIPAVYRMHGYTNPEPRMSNALNLNKKPASRPYDRHECLPPNRYLDRRVDSSKRQSFKECDEMPCPDERFPPRECSYTPCSSKDIRLDQAEKKVRRRKTQSSPTGERTKSSKSHPRTGSQEKSPKTKVKHEQPHSSEPNKSGLMAFLMDTGNFFKPLFASYRFGDVPESKSSTSSESSSKKDTKKMGKDTMATEKSTNDGEVTNPSTAEPNVSLSQVEIVTSQSVDGSNNTRKKCRKKSSKKRCSAGKSKTASNIGPSTNGIDLDEFHRENKRDSTSMTYKIDQRDLIEDLRSLYTENKQGKYETYAEPRMKFAQHDSDIEELSPDMMSYYYYRIGKHLYGTLGSKDEPSVEVDVVNVGEYSNDSTGPRGQPDRIPYHPSSEKRFYQNKLLKHKDRHSHIHRTSSNHVSSKAKKAKNSEQRILKKKKYKLLQRSSDNSRDVMNAAADAVESENHIRVVETAQGDHRKKRGISYDMEEEAMPTSPPGGQGSRKSNRSEASPKSGKATLLSDPNPLEDGPGVPFTGRKSDELCYEEKDMDLLKTESSKKCMRIYERAKKRLQEKQEKGEYAVENFHDDLAELELSANLENLFSALDDAEKQLRKSEESMKLQYQEGNIIRLLKQADQRRKLRKSSSVSINNVKKVDNCKNKKTSHELQFVDNNFPVSKSRHQVIGIISSMNESHSGSGLTNKIQQPSYVAKVQRENEIRVGGKEYSHGICKKERRSKDEDRRNQPAKTSSNNTHVHKHRRSKAKRKTLSPEGHDRDSSSDSSSRDEKRQPAGAKDKEGSLLFIPYVADKSNAKPPKRCSDSSKAKANTQKKNKKYDNGGVVIESCSSEMTLAEDLLSLETNAADPRTDFRSFNVDEGNISKAEQGDEKPFEGRETKPKDADFRNTGESGTNVGKKSANEKKVEEGGLPTRNIYSGHVEETDNNSSESEASHKENDSFSFKSGGTTFKAGTKLKQEDKKQEQNTITKTETATTSAESEIPNHPEPDKTETKRDKSFITKSSVTCVNNGIVCDSTKIGPEKIRMMSMFEDFLEVTPSYYLEDCSTQALGSQQIANVTAREYPAITGVPQVHTHSHDAATFQWPNTCYIRHIGRPRPEAKAKDKWQGQSFNEKQHDRSPVSGLNRKEGNDKIAKERRRIIDELIQRGHKSMQFEPNIRLTYGVDEEDDNEAMKENGRDVVDKNDELYSSSDTGKSNSFALSKNSCSKNLDYYSGMKGTERKQEYEDEYTSVEDDDEDDEEEDQTTTNTISNIEANQYYDWKTEDGQGHHRIQTEKQKKGGEDNDGNDDKDKDDEEEEEEEEEGEEEVEEEDELKENSPEDGVANALKEGEQDFVMGHVKNDTEIQESIYFPERGRPVDLVAKACNYTGNDTGKDDAKCDQYDDDDNDDDEDDYDDDDDNDDDDDDDDDEDDDDDDDDDEEEEEEEDEEDEDDNDDDGGEDDKDDGDENEGDNVEDDDDVDDEDDDLYI